MYLCNILYGPNWNNLLFSPMLDAGFSTCCAIWTKCIMGVMAKLQMFPKMWTTQGGKFLFPASLTFYSGLIQAYP